MGVKDKLFNLKNRNNKIVRKKKAIRMSAYKITKKIIASICIAIFSLCGFAFVCIYSAFMKGDAGFIVGIVPLFMMLCNMAGLIIAYSEIKNEDVRTGHITAGTLSNAFILIVYILIYIVGSMDLIN